VVVNGVSANARSSRCPISCELAGGLLVALLLLSGCSSLLDTSPVGVVPESGAIVDAAGARAASAGSYTALQSQSSYGAELVEVGDVASDNVEVPGIEPDYLDVHLHRLTARAVLPAELWSSEYDGINRVNEIIAKVPTVPAMADSEKVEIIGEAYYLRALEYHNLVKYYGGVPLKLLPTVNVGDAGSVTRASVPEVYAQILMDLDSAAADIVHAQPATRATIGAVMALRARVLLYNRDWTGAEAAAAGVERLGYSLAPNYADLFTATGTTTSEDIFRVDATTVQSSSLSFHYIGLGFIAPTVGMLQAFDDELDVDNLNSFATTDVRGQWSISVAGGLATATKFRSPDGTEKFHVIRLGEVVLIRAEALARLNRLSEAVAELHRIETRANAPLFVLGTHTQQDVIDAIAAERRKELAFEGDRWPDLVRLGIAAPLLGINPTQTLYPIPENDILLAPGLIQNPGY
jgi:starch-binding outer membrane protein, SusD/RagB family